MIDLELEIKNLQFNQDSATQEVGRLEGQKNLLTQQLDTSKAKIVSLETQKINETKAVELLHLVQRSTRDKIKEAFENTVTLALRAIYKEDYQFKLEFGQKGNIGTLDFKLKSPTTQGFLDLKNTTAGGQFDCISIALRLMLLHIVRPKLEGPVMFDEGSKMLSSEYRANEYEFYKSMSEKFGRQFILVTHSKELAELAENKIIIGV
jgi:DNA repair ATPase RecN